MTANTGLRLLLVVWIVGYALIACGPAIAADGVTATLILGALGLLLGSVLFVPWVVGLGVLIALIMLTDPDRRRSRDL